MMSTAMKGRLIGLVVIELVICTMWLFGTVNPAVFAVMTIGVPVACCLLACLYLCISGPNGLPIQT
jgi:hypothetical protein